MPLWQEGDPDRWPVFSRLERMKNATGGEKKIPVIFFFFSYSAARHRRAPNLIGPGRSTTWHGMKGTWPIFSQIPGFAGKGDAPTADVLVISWALIDLFIFIIFFKGHWANLDALRWWRRTGQHFQHEGKRISAWDELWRTADVQGDIWACFIGCLPTQCRTRASRRDRSAVLNHPS